MKRVILYFFISLISGNLLFAQMSDSQVIEYVKTEAAKGTSQQMIATELLKRGATQDQLLRIKSQVNQQNQNTSNINTPTSRPTLRKDVTSETYALRNDSIARLLEYQREYGLLEDNKPVIFGKNIFNQKNLSFLPNMNIPTPEDYKLGPGDEIVIDIWGASQASLQQIISPEGSIVVDRLGPVYLNGMTIREANSYIQQKFSSVYSGIGNEGGSSQIKLTLGQIRTIQINILGEVAVPGTYALSSLSSVFHALYNAGGINDIGSLRSIQLYRKGKLIKTIDIYQYLLNGNASGETRLMDGDIIMVPPYISLVEIVGKIKRPMFYEMTVTETLSDLIKYSGGFTGDAYKEKIDITRKTGKYDKAYTVSSKDFENFILDDKDSIFVSAGLNQFDNRVEIKGAVFRPGYYEVGGQIKTIKNLIEKAGGIKENAFLNRAILTRERADLTRETVPINLKNLFEGRTADINLRKNDMLLVASDSVLVELGSFTIYGDVQVPGEYDYAEGTSIEDLIIKAGGLLKSASLAKVDVSRRIVDPLSIESPNVIADIYTFNIKNGLVVDGPPDFVLSPYDQVYIRRSPGYIEQRNIEIAGEVLFPGRYALKEKTERLSDIVKRAGNLTPHAFSAGARLLREKTIMEMTEERKAMQALSKGLKDSISTDLLNINPYYSVGIELDKAIANPKSEYDLVLREGDQLIVPEYDNTVRINGSVMYPNTVLYKRGQKVSYYINQAGGYSDLAEKKRAYIVYMNGTVAKVKGSNRDAIQPGCNIVIPAKEQKDKMSLAQILSLGTSVTSMASVVALLINNLSK
ncbi:MAG: SLBB domain-containing protein [Dysgonomonas mossii]|uniref:SLBB domain-containing protein n=1 Tax=Dysgonomonas mossii TaxID=163665 RepID=UPI001D6293B4|nr:SLBB domain-containing protein [Dysgonomonas mossii]MBS5795309.1 SLBB domain-containing protein [Dysgonomonas mossii]MBS7109837.1 SLBB domain-containing protein [Dysgonomonas mossii]